MSADAWALCGKGEFRERLRAAAVGPACTAATLDGEYTTSQFKYMYYTLFSCSQVNTLNTY